jgi:DNA-nicking Smr family endonuclease
METARDNDKKGEPTHRQGLSGEEAQLWRRAIADVRPLHETKQQAAPSGAAILASPSAVAVEPAASARPLAAMRPPLPSPVELVSGKAAGIDKRTVARLRRGLIPPETEIDLHQHTQEQAHRLLDGFLAVSQARGVRCVLVITGKGYRSGGVGVLRTIVPRWLNEQPNHPRVLAFCHAAPAHGGDGALYVLLRKSRLPKPR